MPLDWDHSLLFSCTSTPSIRRRALTLIHFMSLARQYIQESACSHVGKQVLVATGSHNTGHCDNNRASLKLTPG